MKIGFRNTIWAWGILITLWTASLLYTESGDGSKRTGMIKGKLIDQTTRQPLAAANVMIESTQLGAATDTTGQYIIDHVSPGIYNVRFMMMGYESRIVNQVVVNPGRTTWQQIELKIAVIESPGVTVTAGYFQTARDAIVSSRSVDYQELRADPGSAEDIQRVMQALPAVVSGADGTNEILVRGGLPGENLFLMDDIEIPNPNHFAEQGTSGGPINMVDPYFVRQIDFYAGAFPARYGDKASSVMDISLREGDRDQLTGHANMGMSGAGLIVEGPIDHGKGSCLLSARRSYLDLILGSIGMEAIPHYYSIQTKWIYDLDQCNKLTFNALYGNDFIEGVDEDEKLDKTDIYKWQFKSGQQVYGLGWRRLLGEKGYLKTTLSEVRSDWNIWDIKNGERDYRNVSIEHERSLKSDIVVLPSPATEIQSGIQLKNIYFNIGQWVIGDTLFYHKLDDDGRILSKEIVQVNDAFSQNRNDNSYKVAAYVNGKWHLSTQWTFSAGIRGDYFRFIRTGAVDPRLGISYHWTPVTSINLAFGHQSQAPCYGEVSAHPMNRDLDYKHTQQAVLGIDHLFCEDTRGTLEIYYKDYRKVPIGVSDLTSDPFDVSNGRGVSQGKGFAKGIEFFLQKKPTGSTHFTVSYAFSLSKAQDPRNDCYYNWDYDYRHMLTLIGGVQFHLKDHLWYQNLKQSLFYKLTAWILPLGDEMEISCRWRYLGGRPCTIPNYHPEYQMWILDENVAINANRYPAYHRLDVRLDQRHMFNGWNIVTYLDIMNVYNRKNIWDYYYKSDGSVDTYNQFSFLPVGGIMVEF